MGELITGYVQSTKNIADLFMKILPSASHRQEMLKLLPWDIYSEHEEGRSNEND